MFNRKKVFKEMLSLIQELRELKLAPQGTLHSETVEHTDGSVHDYHCAVLPHNNAPLERTVRFHINSLNEMADIFDHSPKWHECVLDAPVFSRGDPTAFKTISDLIFPLRELCDLNVFKTYETGGLKEHLEALGKLAAVGVLQLSSGHYSIGYQLCSPDSVANAYHSSVGSLYSHASAIKRALRGPLLEQLKQHLALSFAANEGQLPFFTQEDWNTATVFLNLDSDPYKYAFNDLSRYVNAPQPSYIPDTCAGTVNRVVNSYLLSLLASAYYVGDVCVFTQISAMPAPLALAVSRHPGGKVLFCVTKELTDIDVKTIMELAKWHEKSILESDNPKESPYVNLATASRRLFEPAWESFKALN